MNAGAWGHAFGNIIELVKVIEPDGKCITLNRKQLRFSYRLCAGLENMIMVEAIIKLRKGNTSAINRKMRRILQKRKWLRGFRSAGSIFKNPAGKTAGRLIEDARLKGLTIGGASVSRQHANVIVTKNGAKASDVLSLLEIIRFLVRMKHGIDLESEVEYWE